MVAMETTTVLVNIFKLFKGTKIDYDQIKEENVVRSWNFQFYCFWPPSSLLFLPAELGEAMSHNITVKGNTEEP